MKGVNETSSGTDAPKVKARRIDYKLQDSLFYVARYIFECGYKLKYQPSTISTAAVMFHKFFREVDSADYDKYLIAATVLYLAAKACSEEHSLRDVINVTNYTLHRGTPLDLKDEYWCRRSAIIQAELLVMRMLKFEVTGPNAHKYLLHYLKSLQGWLPRDVWKNTPIVQSSMAFLQDFHHDAAILDYLPQEIAIACINLTMQCYGIQVPYLEDKEGQAWFTPLFKNLKREQVWEIMDQIMEVYNKDVGCAELM